MIIYSRSFVHIALTAIATEYTHANMEYRLYYLWVFLICVCYGSRRQIVVYVRLLLPAVCHIGVLCVAGAIAERCA
jgi:hypothetical protein